MDQAAAGTEDEMAASGVAMTLLYPIAPSKGDKGGKLSRKMLKKQTERVTQIVSQNKVGEKRASKSAAESIFSKGLMVSDGSRVPIAESECEAEVDSAMAGISSLFCKNNDQDQTMGNSDVRESEISHTEEASDPQVKAITAAERAEH